MSSPLLSRQSVPLASPPAEADEAGEKDVTAEPAAIEGSEEELPSEKVMGKRRQRSTSGSGLVPVAEQVLAGAVDEGVEGERFVGKHGFVPTEGWVSSWREGLVPTLPAFFLKG